MQWYFSCAKIDFNIGRISTHHNIPSSQEATVRAVRKWKYLITGEFIHTHKNIIKGVIKVNFPSGLLAKGGMLLTDRWVRVNWLVWLQLVSKNGRLGGLRTWRCHQQSTKNKENEFACAWLLMTQQRLPSLIWEAIAEAAVTQEFSLHGTITGTKIFREVEKNTNSLEPEVESATMYCNGWWQRYIWIKTAAYLTDRENRVCVRLMAAHQQVLVHQQGLCGKHFSEVNGTNKLNGESHPLYRFIKYCQNNLHNYIAVWWQWSLDANFWAQNKNEMSLTQRIAFNDH